MDLLRETKIREAVSRSWPEGKVLLLAETDSTNIQCRRLAEEGWPEGTLVAAETQSAGRGRRGRSWVSPAGSGIWMSLLLRPDLPPDRVSMLTLTAALAVEKGIRSAEGIGSLIKWPNDLVIGGKKICGILTEMRADEGRVDYVVVGIGINAAIREFPEELREKATSLELEAGRSVDRTAVIREVLAAFRGYYLRFLRDQSLAGMREEYNEKLVSMGGEVRVLDPRGEFRGKCLGIGPDGELSVEREDGTKARVISGEVSVRGVYGYA